MPTTAAGSVPAITRRPGSCCAIRRRPAAVRRGRRSPFQDGRAKLESLKEPMNSKKVLLVVLTLIVVGVIAVLGLNLMAGEKKITQHVEHRYDVANPQFARTMGALLGPPLV